MTPSRRSTGAAPMSGAGQPTSGVPMADMDVTTVPRDLDTVVGRLVDALAGFTAVQAINLDHDQFRMYRLTG
jgi:hypothetical protein